MDSEVPHKRNSGLAGEAPKKSLTLNILTLSSANDPHKLFESYLLFVLLYFLIFNKPSPTGRKKVFNFKSIQTTTNACGLSNTLQMN